MTKSEGSGGHWSHSFSFIIISVTNSAYMQAWASKNWCIYLEPTQGQKRITFRLINRNLLLPVLLFKGCPKYHNLVTETTAGFSQNSGTEVETEVSIGWFLQRSLSLAWRWLCLLLVSSHGLSVSVCVLIYSNKNTSCISLGPTLQILF